MAYETDAPPHGRDTMTGKDKSRSVEDSGLARLKHMRRLANGLLGLMAQKLSR